MFERFTARSRHVVVMAQEEARMWGAPAIEPEFLLLGLAAEPESIAGSVLHAHGITAEAIRSKLVVAPAATGASTSLPFTSTTKKILELALREALQLGHNYIGTEHILLGIIREGQSGAARLMIDGFHLDLSNVRQAVIKAIGGWREQPVKLQLASQEAWREARTWLQNYRVVHGPLASHHPVEHLFRALEKAAP